MEETKVIKNKPKRSELRARIEELESQLSNAKWNREWAEKQQTKAEAKVKELQAYIKGLKGLKGEDLEVGEEN